MRSHCLQTSIFPWRVLKCCARGGVCLLYGQVGRGLAMRVLLTNYGLIVSFLAALATMADGAFTLQALPPLIGAMLVQGGRQ